MSFSIRRVNGVIYGESSDGLVKIQFPAGGKGRVVSFCESAEILVPNDEPVLTSEGFGTPGLTYHEVRAQKILAVPSVKPKRQSEKKLVSASGDTFKLTDWICKRLVSPAGKFTMEDAVKELSPHYETEWQCRHAIRVGAMRSRRFAMIDGVLVLTPDATDG